MLAISNAATLSHYLYVDDDLLFCRGTLKNTNLIVSTFAHNGLLSAQFINWKKSFLYFRKAIPIAWQ